MLYRIKDLQFSRIPIIIVPKKPSGIEPRCYNSAFALLLISTSSTRSNARCTNEQASNPNEKTANLKVRSFGRMEKQGLPWPPIGIETLPFNRSGQFSHFPKSGRIPRPSAIRITLSPSLTKCTISMSELIRVKAGNESQPGSLTQWALMESMYYLVV